MGSISWYNVGAAIREHGCRHFVETGTGRGTSMRHAAQFPFETLWTVDIDPLASELAALDDFRIREVIGKSVPFLARACTEIPADEPILFWLDAHFPGCDRPAQRWGEEYPINTRLPLARELETIVGLRHGRDIIVIDDLRIYADLDFTSGQLPDNLRPLCPQDRNLRFIEEILGKSHDFAVYLSGEGYGIATPKVQP